MFGHAIVRRPGQSLIKGLSQADLGQPDYQLALEQHEAYCAALVACGLEIAVLPADEDYPDSVFIEDTALLTPRCAVITRPGAPSRRGETASVIEPIRRFYDHIETIQAPGTIEAGDIMMVGNHFYIGLSQRTNPSGAEQMTAILGKYGMSASTVGLEHVLHLKTGIVYLENNTMATAGEFVDKPEFSAFRRIHVPDDEAYAANCVWINGRVLVAAGFPQTRRRIESAGYPTIALDMSEFRKLDGGLSCLSLRF